MNKSTLSNNENFHVLDQILDDMLNTLDKQKQDINQKEQKDEYLQKKQEKEYIEKIISEIIYNREENIELNHSIDELKDLIQKKDEEILDLKKKLNIIQGDNIHHKLALNEKLESLTKSKKENMEIKEEMLNASKVNNEQYKVWKSHLDGVLDEYLSHILKLEVQNQAHRQEITSLSITNVRLIKENLSHSKTLQDQQSIIDRLTKELESLKNILNIKANPTSTTTIMSKTVLDDTPKQANNTPKQTTNTPKSLGEATMLLIDSLKNKKFTTNMMMMMTPAMNTGTHIASSNRSFIENKTPKNNSSNETNNKPLIKNDTQISSSSSPLKLIGVVDSIGNKNSTQRILLMNAANDENINIINLQEGTGQGMITGQGITTNKGLITNCGVNTGSGTGLSSGIGHGTSSGSRIGPSSGAGLGLGLRLIPGSGMSSGTGIGTSSSISSSKRAITRVGAGMGDTSIRDFSNEIRKPKSHASDSSSGIIKLYSCNNDTNSIDAHEKTSVMNSRYEKCNVHNDQNNDDGNDDDDDLLRLDTESILHEESKVEKKYFGEALIRDDHDNPNVSNDNLKQRTRESIRNELIDSKPSFIFKQIDYTKHKFLSSSDCLVAISSPSASMVLQTPNANKIKTAILEEQDHLQEQQEEQQLQRDSINEQTPNSERLIESVNKLCDEEKIRYNKICDSRLESKLSWPGKNPLETEPDSIHESHPGSPVIYLKGRNLCTNTNTNNNGRRNNQIMLS